MKPLFVLVISAACIFGNPQTKDELLKVVGGKIVNIEDFPYMIQLLKRGRFVCGGSIISPDWIVTAAHCTRNKKDSFSIRAGTSSLVDEGGVVAEVKNIYNHPQYNLRTNENDISVIELAKPLTFGTAIDKISLPQPNEELPVGSTAVLSGWGSMIKDKPLSHTLQAAEVPIIDTDKCKELYRNKTTSGMFCAGPLEGGIGSCKGDSGGPLVVNGVLIGVVSRDRRCAAPNFPGIYVQVSQYRDFITEITGI